MNRLTLFKPQLNAGRFKLFIPFLMKREREIFKSMDGSFYHSNQRLWSLPNTQENIEKVQKQFGNKLEIKETAERTIKPPFFILNEKSQQHLDQLHQKLVLKGFSTSTVENYKSAFSKFLKFFESRDLVELTKEDIEGFVYQQVSKYKLSESSQNSLINAIKAYYEHVLGKPTKCLEQGRGGTADTKHSQQKTPHHTIDYI